MKSLTLPKILVTCIYFGLWLGCLNGKILAQSPPLASCPSGNVAPVVAGGWPQGTTVSVYIDPGITGDRSSCHYGVQ